MPPIQVSDQWALPDENVATKRRLLEQAITFASTNSAGAPLPHKSNPRHIEYYLSPEAANSRSTPSTILNNSTEHKKLGDVKTQANLGEMGTSQDVQATDKIATVKKLINVQLFVNGEIFENDWDTWVPRGLAAKDGPSRRSVIDKLKTAPGQFFHLIFSKVGIALIIFIMQQPEWHTYRVTSQANRLDIYKLIDLRLPNVFLMWIEKALPAINSHRIFSHQPHESTEMDSWMANLRNSIKARYYAYLDLTFMAFFNFADVKQFGSRRAWAATMYYRTLHSDQVRGETLSYRDMPMIVKALKPFFNRRWIPEENALPPPRNHDDEVYEDVRAQLDQQNRPSSLRNDDDHNGRPNRAGHNPQPRPFPQHPPSPRPQSSNSQHSNQRQQHTSPANDVVEEFYGTQYPLRSPGREIIPQDQGYQRNTPQNVRQQAPYQQDYNRADLQPPRPDSRYEVPPQHQDYQPYAPRNFRQQAPYQQNYNEPYPQRPPRPNSGYQMAPPHQRYHPYTSQGFGQQPQYQQNRSELHLPPPQRPNSGYQIAPPPERYQLYAPRSFGQQPRFQQNYDRQHPRPPPPPNADFFNHGPFYDSDHQ